MAGGRKETVSDDEILRLFVETSDPILSTAEVADELGFSKTGARDRLYQLVEEGRLEYKRIGNSPAFWLTDSGEDLLDSN
jgi:predicted ArsR family transcriptional regulator